jgi:hypothetical protein
LRRLEADVFPAFGHKFIDNVTPADIRKLMLAIEDRGARDAAQRAHETTGQIFRYAIAHGIASRNPAADFKPKDILAEAAEENFSRVDAKELPTLLAKMVDYDEGGFVRLATLRRLQRNRQGRLATVVGCGVDRPFLGQHSKVPTRFQ